MLIQTRIEKEKEEEEEGGRPTREVGGGV